MDASSSESTLIVPIGPSTTARTRSVVRRIVVWPSSVTSSTSRPMRMSMVIVIEGMGGPSSVSVSTTMR